MTRSTTNRNARGSSRDRAVRRRWLVDTFGDGVKVASRAVTVHEREVWHR